MDARAVVVAAVACLVLAVAFSVGAITTSGPDPRLIWNAGVGFTAITIGLFAGAGLYARVQKVERGLDMLTQEITKLRKDIGVHKAHDQEALHEAAGLGDTGPNGVRHLRG